ncbi:MAG TPA: magnesium chelatase domain-containing protein, partial [bacterium]|nr:magnesium chelatase domain-containing protein [bacterium]
MSTVTLLSAGILGIDAFPIHVEVDIGQGLPGWSTVGLPESAVRESKDRVIAAIHNCGYEFPFHRITLNLAPADVKKQGTAYDLPIALGLLAASGVVDPRAIEGYALMGELTLHGKLRPVRGA